MKNLILSLVCVFFLVSCDPVLKELPGQAEAEQADEIESTRTFTEVISIIQRGHIEQHKLKELVSNAIKGMEKEVARKQYETEKLKLDWKGIGNNDKKAFKLFEKAYNFYTVATDIPSKELLYAAIQSMLEMMDPHSALLIPDVDQKMQVVTKGKFGGLGIVINIRDEVLTVISPIDDTPAFKAGIKEGDIILEIDGESTKDITLMDAVKKLQGPKGTKVTITIMRGTFTEPRKLTITRDVIRIPSIKSKMLEDGYGYIRITQYPDRADQDLEKTLRKLESSPGGLKGLVLDLRRNPGGLMEQAAKVADRFLDSGLIVYTKGRTPGPRIDSVAHKENSHTGYPMVVLVNKGTAGGSEIVAGALQDNGRALIVGTKTFGNGSVQMIFPLRDGLALNLTTARVFTPKGHSIQDKGITPDIVVDQPKLESIGDINSDVQLQRAVEILKAGRK